MKTEIKAVRKSLNDLTLRLTKKAQLNEIQLAVLAGLLQTNNGHHSLPPKKIGHYEKADVQTAAAELQALGWFTVVTEPKTKEIIVRLLGRDEHHDLCVEAIKHRFGDQLPNLTAVSEAKPAKAKVEHDPSVVTLNWAFRRLRRQCVIFYSNGDKDLAAKLRRQLDTVEENYWSLRRQFEADNNDLIALADPSKGRSFDDFLAWFFSHEIKPGSRAAQ